jgi:hypothetical protein
MREKNAVIASLEALTMVVVFLLSRDFSFRSQKVERDSMGKTNSIPWEKIGLREREEPI